MQDMKQELEQLRKDSKNLKSFARKLNDHSYKNEFVILLFELYPYLKTKIEATQIKICCKFYYENLNYENVPKCSICGQPVLIVKSGAFGQCGDPKCILKKKDETNIKKFGAANPFSNPEIKNKIKATNFEKYGTHNPSQSESIKQKKLETTKKNYGVENPSQSSIIKEKKIKTSRLNYGVDCSLQNKKVREKGKVTMKERYGNEIPTNCPVIKEKIKKTNLEKYGVEHPGQNKIVQDKMKATNLERRGVEYSGQSPVVKEKIKATNLERYGVECGLLNKEIREKGKKTNLKRFGVENPFSNEQIKKQIKKTNLEKYGVEYPSQNDEIKKKVMKSNLERYGVEYISQNTEVKNKIKEINLKKTILIFKQHNYEFIKLEGEKLTLKCPTCGKDFTGNRHFLIMRKCQGLTICTHCFPYKSNISSLEIELLNFIKSLGFEPEQSNRKVLENKEIDIYIPELKIGFEFNGIYWHSDGLRGRKYHQEKKLLAASKDINLIHIWEDDWKLKPEIVKSRIRNILGKNEHKIFARKCKIVELDSKTYVEFLKQNHLQGSINSKLKFGLLYEDVLVSVMGIGIRNGKMELLRFCNKLNYSVVGAFSKLLKYFKNLNPNSELISYGDLDWSPVVGNVYEKNGGELLGITPPAYFWSDGQVKQNRIKFQKHKLIKEGWDASLSEDEIMVQRGFIKIYNSGNLKYRL